VGEPGSSVCRPNINFYFAEKMTDNY
jgi:hypothetical protein